MGMMHTRCIQAHMLEHHPKIECPVRCRQQEQLRRNNDEVAPATFQEDGNTIDTITTATLVSDVPCCSACDEPFPVNQWVAASRCPIAEAYGTEKCDAELLHRYCVQAHYVICHPQEECPKEFTQREAQQTQRMFQEVRQLACRQCSKVYMSLNRKCRNCRRPLCAVCEPDPLYICISCQANYNEQSPMLMDRRVAALSTDVFPNQGENVSVLTGGAAE